MLRSSKMAKCIVCFPYILTFEATLANVSTSLFSDLGNCCSSIASNPAINSFSFLRYDNMVGSFARYILCTWLTTSWESLNTFTKVTPIYFTSCKPTSKTSYSASLNVAEKPKCNDYSSKSSTGLFNKILACQHKFATLTCNLPFLF